MRLLARRFAALAASLCHGASCISGRRAARLPPKRRVALVRSLSGTAPSELTTASAGGLPVPSAETRLRPAVARPGPLPEDRQRGRGVAGALILAVPIMPARSKRCLHQSPAVARRAPRLPRRTRRLHRAPLCAVRLIVRARGLAKRRAVAKKSQYLKYPLVAPRNPPRDPRDARGRRPNTVGARRCKRGKI